MCGIAGIVVRDGKPSLTALEAMQSALRHRGPDSKGQHVDGRGALAHTRLSIIDLDGGQQPFFSPGRDQCLIANGEIYNFQTVRDGLARDGYPFTSRSDCEVILPLYDQHQENCVEHLRGMFAFALWDGAKNKLLLGRDRMGEKPLYYAFTDKELVFASELRALLASGLIEPQLDDRQIARFFRYQYVPEPFTPFRGIHKLAPGSTLLLDADGWTIEQNKYWSAWDAPPIEGDPKTELRRVLEDAVQTSLISDVPLGLSLSGGIDSSILACLMKAYTDKPVHAISIGYPDAAQVDERPDAKQLADRLGIQFHDVELSDSQMIESFEDVVTSRDDPIADISGYNYFAIMQAARAQGLKVMLQGHGIDELCWGYPWMREALMWNEGRRPPVDVSVAPSLRGKLAAAARYLRNRMKPFPKEFYLFEQQPFSAWVTQNAKDLFTTEFVERSGWGKISAAAEYGLQNERADLEVTRLVVDYYLLENGIAQGDRLSMAHSVEMRLPFVDHKFVETVVGLRKAQRDDHLPMKYWIKESVRDLLGDTILDRPKRGFEPPVRRWQDSLRAEFGNNLKDGLLVEHGILSAEMAKRFTEPSIRNSAEATVSRMAIILETWLRGVKYHAASKEQRS